MIWVSHHRKQKRLEGDCFFDGARLESVNICQASQVRRLTELPVETKGGKRCCRAMEKVEFRINFEFLNNKMKWEIQQRFADDTNISILGFFCSNIEINFSSIKRLMCAKSESGQRSCDSVLPPNLKSVCQMDFRDKLKMSNPFVNSLNLVETWNNKIEMGGGSEMQKQRLEKFWSKTCFGQFTVFQAVIVWTFERKEAWPMGMWKTDWAEEMTAPRVSHMHLQ